MNVMAAENSVISGKSANGRKFDSIIRMFNFMD